MSTDFLHVLSQQREFYKIKCYITLKIHEIPYLGINIGDEILTDAILTAVDENGGNESVIVQPLDLSPTELAITGNYFSIRSFPYSLD